MPLTAYDLPLYTPCVYLSQLAQYMDSQNVRVWKETTATEIVDTLLVMARYVRPDIETARVVIAALHDMVYLYPGALNCDAGRRQRRRSQCSRDAQTRAGAGAERTALQLQFRGCVGESLRTKKSRASSEFRPGDFPG